MDMETTRPAKSTAAQRRRLLDLMEEHTTRTMSHSDQFVNTWKPTRTIREEREALKGMAHMSAAKVAEGIEFYTEALKGLAA